MAFLQTRVPVLIMSITILLVLLTITKGFGMKQPGPCRAVCTENDCITLNQDKVDFKTAEEECHDSNGKLLVFQSETDKSLFDILSQELLGNYWIGLHLPAGTCSNLSAPLRGYEWTSGKMDGSFIPSFSSWKESSVFCSPHCVSLSSDQKWTERLCSDIIDGFMCKTKLEDACWGQEVSHPIIFQSSKGCLSGPCEHTCNDVKGGYTCSCFLQHIPDSKDPRQCKPHCAEQKCPLICETKDYCSCPDGFLKNENFCVDFDECEMESDCDQECKNTFGSFECSCREGFVLKDRAKCIKAEDSEGLVITTPVIVAFVKPANDSNTLKTSSARVSHFLWIWIVVVVAVVVSIFVIRCYVVKRQRQRENSNPHSLVNVTMDNNEC